MLEIIVPENKLYNDQTWEFVTIPETVLHLEHSLVSISKWEAKWHKTFLANNEKSDEEKLDYIRCMTLNRSVNENVYLGLSKENVDAINAYIENPMTATVLRRSEDVRPARDKTTSELIYYWMITLNIPFECQKWHINRLLTLIEVCSRKNAPKKNNKGLKNTAARNKLNAARRAKLGSKG